MLPKRVSSTDFTGFKIDDAELAFYLHGRKRWELNRYEARDHEVNKALEIAVRWQGEQDTLNSTLELLGCKRQPTSPPPFYYILLEASIAHTDALVYNDNFGWVAESTGMGTGFLHADARQLQGKLTPSQTRLEEVW